jgi:hypothetical protein
MVSSSISSISFVNIRSCFLNTGRQLGVSEESPLLTDFGVAVMLVLLLVLSDQVGRSLFQIFEVAISVGSGVGVSIGRGLTPFSSSSSLSSSLVVGRC